MHEKYIGKPDLKTGVNEVKFIQDAISRGVLQHLIGSMVERYGILVDYGTSWGFNEFGDAFKPINNLNALWIYPGVALDSSHRLIVSEDYVTPIVPNDDTWRNYYLRAEAEKKALGTISVTSGSKVITGLNTKFTRYLAKSTYLGADTYQSEASRGDKIAFSYLGTTYTLEIDQIKDDNEAWSTENATITAPLAGFWIIGSYFSTANTEGIHQRIKATISSTYQAGDMPICAAKKSAGVLYIMDLREGSRLRWKGIRATPHLMPATPKVESSKLEKFTNDAVLNAGVGEVGDYGLLAYRKAATNNLFLSRWREETILDPPYNAVKILITSALSDPDSVMEPGIIGLPDGQTAIITYTKGGDSFAALYCKTSIDGGATWTGETKIYEHEAKNITTSCMIFSYHHQAIILAFHVKDVGVYFYKSTDYGGTFQDTGEIITFTNTLKYLRIKHLLNEEIAVGWYNDTGKDIRLHRGDPIDGGFLGAAQTIDTTLDPLCLSLECFDEFLCLIYNSFSLNIYDALKYAIGSSTANNKYLTSGYLCTEGPGSYVNYINTFYRHKTGVIMAAVKFNGSNTLYYLPIIPSGSPDIRY